MTLPPAWRPVLRRPVRRNGLNDSNGLVFHDSEWHQFYLYNLQRDRRAHMRRGHAISADWLLRQDLPVALLDDAAQMIFRAAPRWMRPTPAV